MAHALIVIPLAFRSLRSRVLAKDPVFGYDPMVGDVLAMSSGYVQVQIFKKNEDWS
jgi:hypothetical protein